MEPLIVDPLEIHNYRDTVIKLMVNKPLIKIAQGP